MVASTRRTRGFFQIISWKNSCRSKKALHCFTQQFADRLARAKVRIQSCLSSLKLQGKKIAGYGASVGSTTFIYYFELGKYLDFLVDDNQIKHGTFSPGLHLEVHSLDKAIELSPDYLAVISWRYSKPITARAQRYLHQGGQIMNLFPAMLCVDKTGARPVLWVWGLGGFLTFPS